MSGPLRKKLSGAGFKRKRKLREEEAQKMSGSLKKFSSADQEQKSTQAQDDEPDC